MWAEIQFARAGNIPVQAKNFLMSQICFRLNRKKFRFQDFIFQNVRRSCRLQSLIESNEEWFNVFI